MFSMAEVKVADIWELFMQRWLENDLLYGLKTLLQDFILLFQWHELILMLHSLK